MTSTALLRFIDFVVTIGVNSVVLCYSYTAYRKTQMRAFALWIAAATICIISTVAMHTYGYSRTLSPEDYKSFMILYRVGYAIQALLGCAGTVMLIRHVISTFNSPARADTQPETTQL